MKQHIIARSPSSDRLLKVAITFLVMATLISIFSRTIADADLWGHLRFGLDILESGEITQVDPYSYLSTGQRWINHEWLAEVFFGLAWLAGASSGLILLKTTIGLITMGLIYFHLMNQGLSQLRAGSLVILASLAVIPAIATVRPHMFTLLFSVLIFLILANAETGDYRWLWAAPIVFALWVNFHGGFLAGLGFLGIWTFMHVILHRQDWRYILPPVLVSFLAVLVNPYGIDLIIFLLRTGTIPRPEIVEWQPIQPVSILGGIYLILLVIALLGLIYSWKQKNLPLVILLGVAALLPFIAVRHLPLFAFAVLIFAGEYIADAWSRIPGGSKKASRFPIWVPGLLVITGIFLLIWGYPNFLKIKITTEPEPYYPDQAVSLLKESQVSGNLAVPFNWGEYVIWHLSPNIKVSVDGRRETVYSDEVYSANLSFQYGVNDWDAVIENFDTDFALVKKSQPAYNLMMMKPGWEIIYEDSTSALFASQKWIHIKKLREAATNHLPSTPSSRFP